MPPSRQSRGQACRPLEAWRAERQQEVLAAASTEEDPLAPQACHTLEQSCQEEPLEAAWVVEQEEQSQVVAEAASADSLVHPMVSTRAWRSLRRGHHPVVLQQEAYHLDPDRRQAASMDYTEASA